MRTPTESDAEAIVRWRAPLGVISAYVDLRPEDRGAPWRIEVRNGLAAIRDAASGERRRAVEATAERIEGAFEANHDDPHGRTRIGFVEVGAKGGREEWFAVQAPLEHTELVHDERPRISPLLAILDGHAPRGVAAVTAERVRLLRWSLGGLEELDDWGLEIFSLDWRERKSKRPSDPARVQGATASGRDQYGQRLEANRERFLQEVGRLAAARAKRGGCRELLAFGQPALIRSFAEGTGPGYGVRALEDHNLLGAPLEEIEDRLWAHLSRLQREREEALIDRVQGEARSGGHGALGADETARALSEGRVEHLILTPRANRPELLVEAALAGGARVTQVSADDGDPLAEAEGVGALLRY